MNWTWKFWPFNKPEDDEGAIEYGVTSGYGTYVDLDKRKFPMANEPDPQSPPHTHDWDVWEITKEGSIVREGDTSEWNSQDVVIGTYIDQRRRCKTCGKHELDTQVSYAIEE